ncbi:hypothetical protein IT570_11625 [Candidatus Sumerlaeota bacterium]|nr:hypothetical protein [Candidatus Sumerlaeota bacterium]
MIEVGTSRPHRELVLFALGLACVLAFFIFRCWMFWALTVDDAYITMRQAGNLVHGYGFVYNIGGPAVESYTNHSLFLVQALLIACGLNVVFFTKLIGVFSGLAVIAGALVLARMLLQEGGLGNFSLQWLLPGAWVLADSPILATGAVAGLETALFTALTTWSVVLMFRIMRSGAVPSRVQLILAGGVLGLSTWTRPEGIAWALGLCVVAVFVLRSERPKLRGIALIALIVAVFWISLTAYRYMVFGYPFPNSYYVKMGGGTLSRAASGFQYFRDWALLNRGGALLLIALVGVICTPRGGRILCAVALASVLGHLAVTIYEGGDWMPHLRMIAPCMGVLAALVSASFAALAHRLAPLRQDIIGCVSLLCFCPLWTISLQKELRRAMGEVQVRVYGWADAHEALAMWLASWEETRESTGKPPLVVAIEDIGLVGYHSDIRIIDLAGLADPVWAHYAYDTGLIYDYPAGPLVIDKRPDVIVLVTQTPPDAPETRMDWHTNQAVFKHPDFPRLYRYGSTWTHKDFPGDGYFLNVYLRNDVFNEPPKPQPPLPRARKRG